MLVTQSGFSQLIQYFPKKFIVIQKRLNAINQWTGSPACLVLYLLVAEPTTSDTNVCRESYTAGRSLISSHQTVAESTYQIHNFTASIYFRQRYSYMLCFDQPFVTQGPFLTQLCPNRMSDFLTVWGPTINPIAHSRLCISEFAGLLLGQQHKSLLFSTTTATSPIHLTGFLKGFIRPGVVKHDALH